VASEPDEFSPVLPRHDIAFFHSPVLSGGHFALSLSHPAAKLPLARETHMREDLAIFDFQLTEAERRAVDEIFLE